MERPSRSVEMVWTLVVPLPARDCVPTQQRLKIHYEPSHLHSGLAGTVENGDGTMYGSNRGQVLPVILPSARQGAEEPSWGNHQA